MTGPENRHSRAKWALFAAIMIVGAGTLALTLDTKPAPGPQSVVPSPPAQPATSPNTPPVQVEAQPLGREALLSAVAAAASSAAGGAQPPSQVIGRSFTIRLPFGCSTPNVDLPGSWAGWSIDPKTQTLKLRAKPENWATAPWIKGIAPDMPVDAVEGFWVRRPWTSSESCPVNPKGPAQIDGVPDEVDRPGPRQTVGLAQFFSPEGSRTLRRGERPYSATLRVEELEPRGQYRLALTGRIVGYPDGRSTRCMSEDINLPPICVIAVEFTRVAFEDALNGAILSEWRN